MAIQRLTRMCSTPLAAVMGHRLPSTGSRLTCLLRQALWHSQTLPAPRRLVVRNVSTIDRSPQSSLDEKYPWDKEMPPFFNRKKELVYRFIKTLTSSQQSRTSSICALQVQY